MKLTLERRIQAFTLLGKELKAISEALGRNKGAAFNRQAVQNLFQAASETPNHNPWFSRDNVIRSFSALAEMLDQGKLEQWIGTYPALASAEPLTRRQVAVIMAGNIPLVGFHDFLCVLMAGNQFLGKLSSQDPKLPLAVGELLTEIEPLFLERIRFSENPISGFDAVIATGSNNSARYFDHYFGKHPHIIRRNRNSLAVLNGNESPEELKLLGEDVFSFFGLGCRNVSKLMVTEGFDISQLEEAWSDWRVISDHHKYFNNYEYFKAIHLVNRTPFLDMGFCLLRQDAALASPVSVVHYEHYPSEELLEQHLERERENIQCIVGRPNTKGTVRVPFGNSQNPGLGDYADGIDTMEFLLNLS
ncbi:MAG: hypothetical protein V2I46_01840 [Bacteroides sp.]|jgi:hypothetical protein|nr:hypothetical protein [Bacteroides sp.]